MDVSVSTSSGIDYQLQQLWLLLSGVNSIVAVFGFGILVVAIYLIKPAKWWAIAVLLDVSSFSSFEYTGSNIISPLSQIRLYGRAIVVVLLISMLLPAVLADRGWRLQLLTPATVCLVIFETIVTVRTEGPMRLALDTFTYLLIFTTLGVGLAKWIQSLEDATDAVKAVAMSGVLFLIGSYAQIIVDRTQVVWNGRFLGTTGNPNHAGVVLAISLLAMLYMMLSAQTSYRWRVFFAGMAVLDAFTIFWTGSRTAVLVALIGVVVQFRRRLGAMIIVGMLTAVVGLAIWQVSAADASADRVMTLEDTRSTIWLGMANVFLKNPFIGDNSGVVVGTENSYLNVAARTGLIGLLPLFFMMFMVGRLLIQNWHGRRQLRQFSPLSDFVIGALLAVFAGALFEGYLVGVITMPVLSMYIFLTLGGFISDVNKIAAAQGGELLEPEDYPIDAELSFSQYGHATY